MGSALMWVAGTVAVASALVRLYRARRRLTAGVVYLCTAVATVGCSAGLVAPLTVELLMPVEPFANFTRWAANSLAMIAAWAVHALLLHLVYDRDRARPAVQRQAALLAGALVAATALLLGADLPSAPNFVQDEGNHWQVMAYVAVFCGYVGYSLSQFVRLMGYYAGLSRRVWLRRGLAMTRLGAAIGIGWAVVKILAALSVLTGHSGGWEGLASAVLSASCVALVGLGMTMPTWGPVCAIPLRWARHFVTDRELRPLWTRLQATFPHIDRSAPSQPDSLVWQVTRRIVEIEDALLLLAPYRRPSTTPLPRTSDPEATREALEIRHALLVADQGLGPPVAEPPSLPHRDLQDLDAEAAWLRRVARAYRRLPATDEHSSTERQSP